MPNMFADMFLDVEYTLLFIMLCILIQISIACFLILISNIYGTGYLSIPFVITFFIFYGLFSQVQSHGGFSLIALMAGIPVIALFVHLCKLSNQDNLKDKLTVKLFYLSVSILSGVASIYMIRLIENWR